MADLLADGSALSSKEIVDRINYLTAPSHFNGDRPWMSPPCVEETLNEYVKISVYCSRRKSGVKSSTGGLTILKSNFDSWADALVLVVSS